MNRKTAAAIISAAFVTGAATAALTAGISTLSAQPEAPAPTVLSAYTVQGEDRYCTLPLDGTETVVTWTETIENGTTIERSEVSTTVDNARCHPPLEAEKSEISFAPAEAGDTPNP